MPDPFDLQEAQQHILDHTPTRGAEKLPLLETLDRVPCEDVKAVQPVPPFRQSARDGFAVSARDIRAASSRQPVPLKICGENAAGDQHPPEHKKREAIRIMTGAMVPQGIDLVIPLEECTEKDGGILVTSAGVKGEHIRPAGADVRDKQTIAPAGRPIMPDHLSLLATAGVAAITVYQKPKVGILCTGSELVDIEATPRAGQIISGNRFLLNGLIQKARAIPMDLGTAEDDPKIIVDSLRNSLAEPLQILITTGGMGPGKYDVVAAAFKELGGKIIYRSLKVRPGKATLFGTLGKTLFFGLPGSPPAVRLLFHELVAPALRKAQGIAPARQKLIKAHLTQGIKAKEKGVLGLKGAVLEGVNEKIIVRPAGKLEPINGIIHLPAHRRQFVAGEMIPVLPIDL